MTSKDPTPVDATPPPASVRIAGHNGCASATVARPPERLSLSTKILYGAPNLAGAALIVPILINMPKFYADVVLVPLGFLAIAIALARSLDAISDPAVGWFSDRTRTRWGRRRPYIFVGAPLCAIAFWALMSPPAHLQGREAGLWFAVSFILFFIFHTIFILPYYALGPELTLDYNERSSLFGIREAFTILGTIIAAGAPGFLMKGLGWNDRRVFSSLGIVFAVGLTALFWLLAARVRERPEFATREPNPLVPGVRRALRNRPFSILLGSYVLASISGLIPATLLPFYNSYVIQPKNPNLWLSILLLGYFGMAFLCLPLWLAAARRFGKLPTWLASFGMAVSGGGAMFFLGKGDIMLLLFLICWAWRELRSRVVPGSGDAGGRDRLRRIPHRPSPRGPVRRLLEHPAQVRRDSQRGDPDRDPRVAWLRTERGAAAPGLARDQGDLRTGTGLLRNFVLPDCDAIPDQRGNPSRDPRGNQAP